ncbi:hypothetical protein [Streptomyces sp. E5N298]|uniref:hypothetical protein n=1 Tax=Streptomyces sp. E5N298 TaxID=1851983 RepID=UPI000EF5C2B8|nr:hypothetical protein [Streptomyces sp. E5N298]
MNPLRNVVNRTLLALAGAALLAGGGWAVLTSDAVAGRLPGRWPTADAGTVLLDRGGLADLRGHGWWTPAVVAGTVCVLLLCLAWFLTQFRGGGRRLPLAGPSLTLRSRALADAVARRAEATEGVDRAHVHLPAGKKRSAARVRVLLEPGAEPGPVLERLTRGPLDEARASLAPHPLSTHVRLGVRSDRERRAR